MHRIDAAGFAAGNLFTDGNPATGTPATVVDAAWLNDLQENVVGVIAAAGIALAKGDYTQLLAALRSAGVFQTAAQFDTSTKVATMAALKAAGLQFAGEAVLAATTVLTAAAHAGKLIVLNNAGAATYTLPAANSCPAGTVIGFMGYGSGTSTIQRAGADSLGMPAALASVTLGQGDTLFLETDGAATWRAFGGSAQLGYSSRFTSSLAANGYKKYPDASSPSGFVIEQWGVVNTAAATPGATVTFPIAFPNAVLFTVAASAGGNNTSNTSAVTLTSMAVTTYQGSNGAAVAIASVPWFAKGY